MIKSYFRKLFSDLHSAIVAAIVAALVLSAGGIYLFSKKIWILLTAIFVQPTPLWVTILIVLAVLVYIYSKSKKPVQYQYSTDQFIKKFGVLWDDDLNMRCNYCTTLLKQSTHGPPKYYCSNPHCNEKYILKDKEGHPLTEQEAFDRIKRELNRV